MRGNWSVKCLEGQGKRLVARAESVDPLETGREFREWVELMLGTAEEEYKLLLELSPLSSSQMVASAYGTLMTPILSLFHQILTQVITLIKKSLHKYNFLALSAYEGLLSLQRHWDDILSRRGSDHKSEKNEPKDGLQSLRGLCLRSFPEFLADIKMGALTRGLDTNVKLMEFTTMVRILTRSTVSFTNQSSDNCIHRKDTHRAERRRIGLICPGGWKLEDGRGRAGGKGK